MSLFSKKNVKDLLKKHRVHLSKRLGQNFLIDSGAIRKVIEAANLQPNNIVLEIGPGIGNLTEKIAQKVKKVIGVEKDPQMVEILKETLKDFKNIKIIQADILKLNFQFSIFNFQKRTKSYKIVANIPFYLTAPVIRKFLEIGEKPKEMTLVVQKEVAQRICAKVPKMNLLAVSVQFYAKPKIISYISKKSFRPQPAVDAAILQITPLSNGRDPVSTALFFKIVKAGFSQPRKQLANNLSKGLALPNFAKQNLGGLAPSPPNRLKLNKEQVKSWLLKNNIQPEQRAETLTVGDWIKLTKTYINYF